MLGVYDNKGLVFNIQKFSIHDGRGMRTLVFMKGCPLSCIWCSNPESQSPQTDIMDIKKNCIGCSNCYNVCPNHAISKENFNIDRLLCDNCGECTKKCYANAKKEVGQWYSIAEIMEKIEKDYIIYRNSEGGVTVGGGEPTLQAAFVSELLEECHSINVHTAIETCGYGSWSNVKNVFEHADQIFFDLKHMDSKKHRKLTGVDNYSILENAQNVAKMNKEIIFRLPLIPNLNDSQSNVKATGEFVASIMTSFNDIKIEILPYHDLGKNKYEWLTVDYALKDLKAPEKESVQQCREILKKAGCSVI